MLRVLVGLRVALRFMVPLWPFIEVSLIQTQYQGIGYPYHGDAGELRLCTMEAFIITYTILGAPYYNYSIMGPN